jgi:hypothetical protein
VKEKDQNVSNSSIEKLAAAQAQKRKRKRTAKE